MKLKIAILGSTGSIGKNLLNIVEDDKKNIEIVLLTANKSSKHLIKQAKLFNVKNIIITNNKSYKYLQKKNKDKKIKIFNNFNNIENIIKKKIDYTMCSISGLEGLIPTLKMIKHTKRIAIANKEAIICGWNIIQKELSTYKTKFIPVDSEHFSIWYALNNDKKNSIEKIYLTASGGPFYKLPLNKFKNINIEQAISHPNWKMGKKISVDSSTMMNKVFEIIEAKNIFDVPYNKISILIHPASYVHALIKFNNGVSKLIAHDTSMKIPIFNTLYWETNKTIKTKNLDLIKLNNLDFKLIDRKRYPLTKILKILPNNFSLFETILVSANDEIVKLFLDNKIKFTQIAPLLMKFIKLKEFNKYKEIQPKTIDEIVELNNYVRLKINSMSV